ncbi:MAG TPA: histidinol dehydrogenase [Actinomycetota bacterium]|nr:histidinol dehydrogenase [Actinomycetota bacterium]
MLEIVDGRGQETPVHIARPRAPRRATSAEEAVRQIVDSVRLRGDAAVVEHALRLDGVRLRPDELRVDPDAVVKARALVRPELVDALEVMAERVRATSERQLPQPWIDRRPDELVGELVRPLRRVGVYAPGGRAAYPSTVIMAAIPARVAGVGTIAVATPPRPDGSVPESVLAACAVAGIDEVYRVGGAQAIAALAYGTEHVRPVEKVVGPGNQFVTLAKRLVAGWVGTDADAGPAEVAIVAGEGASPDVLAADLVAGAEQGPLGTHALITWIPALADAVCAALEHEVLVHPRGDDVESALVEGGRAVLVRDMRHALDTANSFAPEHLQLSFDGARDALPDVRSAGAVFVGPLTPVAVGDYVGGTNHVLPTGGAARFSSGLGASDFVKRIYVSGLERTALERMAPHVEALAEAEGLPGRARALRARLGDA